MKIKEVFIETLNAIRLRSREFSAGFFLCVFRHGISSSFVLFGRWRSFAATGDEHFLSVFVVTDNSIHVVASVSSYFIVRLCFLFHAQQTTITKKKIVLYYRFWTFSVPHEWLRWQRWHCMDDNDAWTEQRPCTHWRRATRSGKSRNNKQKQKHPMISIAYYYFIVKYFWILIMCSMCHWWKWIYEWWCIGDIITCEKPLISYIFYVPNEICELVLWFDWESIGTPLLWPLSQWHTLSMASRIQSDTSMFIFITIGQEMSTHFNVIFGWNDPYLCNS